MVLELPGTIVLDVSEPRPRPRTQVSRTMEPMVVGLRNGPSRFYQGTGGTLLEPVGAGAVLERVQIAFEGLESENIEEWRSPHDFRRLQAEVAAAGAFLDGCAVLINLLCYLETAEELGRTAVSEKIVVTRGERRGISDELLLHLLDGKPIRDFEGFNHLPPPLVEVSFEVVELSFASPFKLSLRSTVRILQALAAATQLSVNAETLYKDFRDTQDKQKDRSTIEGSYKASTEAEKVADMQMSEYLREMRMGGVGALQTYLQSLGYYPGPIDGKADAKTRKTIVDFARDNGLPEDGENIAFRRGVAKAMVLKSSR